MITQQLAKAGNQSIRYLLTLVCSSLALSAAAADLQLTGDSMHDRAVLAGLNDPETAIALLPDDRQLAADIIADWLLHNRRAAVGTEGAGREDAIWVGADDNCDYNSIQDAIDAAPGFPQSTHIKIVNNLEYTDQVLRIEDKHITMTGISSGTCQVLGFGSERVTLDGSGTTNRPVIRIRNNGINSRMQVRLFNLSIQGGSTSTSSLGCSEARRNGGGLNILGRVQATLNNTLVRDNITQSGGGTCSSTRTAHGGGIYFNSENTEDASLRLEDGSGVLNNETRSTSSSLASIRHGHGGGIALFGAELTLADPNVNVSLNRTAGSRPGFGGGIFLEGPSSSLLSHAGGLLSGILLNQTAPGSETHGGGVYISADASLTLRPRDPGGHSPVIGSNTADGNGGGIRSLSASINLEEATISNNLSRRHGGAIAARNSSLDMRSRPIYCAQSALPLPICSRLSGNTARGSGGALHLIGHEPTSSDSILIGQTYIYDNQAIGGGSVAAVAGPEAHLVMEGVFIYGNHGSPYLFSLMDQSLTAVHWSTIAGNPEDRHAVFHVVNQPENDTMTRLRLHGSIVWEPGAVIATRSGPTFTPSRCSIGHQPLAESGLSVGSNFYSQINPELIDPASGDLRPGPTSPAIDYCDSGTHPPLLRDIASQFRNVPYNQPTTAAPNSADGDYDIGGYEVQPLPLANADLFVSAEFDPEEADVGQSVALSISAGNLGPDSVGNVIAEYLLPEGYEFLSADPFDGISHSFSPTTGQGLWDIGDLDVNEVAELTINLAVTEVPEYVVFISIEGDGDDPDSSNDSAEVSIIVSQSSDDIFADRFE